MTADVKRAYAFGKDAEGNNVTEGNKDMKNILGGKGANLAEMALIGLPVPPGFTITCQSRFSPRTFLPKSILSSSLTARSLSRRTPTFS